MSGLKSLKKGDILFREGDPSEAMYVIKSGKIAIVKAKGTSEIMLAELGPGDMLGEMAFFDNRARSAGAKASADTTVIELPFKALNAQFKTFPEWLKAIVRTVNNHLRNANMKIKELQTTSAEETEYFPAHTVTRLMAILGLVTERYGEKAAEGVLVPFSVLRRYTIQVFQLPTVKMERLCQVLESMQYMKTEDLGEGRFKITVFKPDEIVAFTDFYTDWLFKSEDKKATLFPKELNPLKALVHYGKKQTPDAKGDVRVNVTEIQDSCQTNLGFPFSVDDVNGFAEKKLTSEKFTTDAGLAVTFNLKELEMLHPYWELIHAFKKVQREP